MSKPVYEIPIGDGERLPAAGRRSAGADGEAPTIHPNFATPVQPSVVHDLGSGTPSSPSSPIHDINSLISPPVHDLSTAPPPSRPVHDLGGPASLASAPPPAFGSGSAFPPPAGGFASAPAPAPTPAPSFEQAFAQQPFAQPPFVAPAASAAAFPPPADAQTYGSTPAPAYPAPSFPAPAAAFPAPAAAAPPAPSAVSAPAPSYASAPPPSLASTPAPSFASAPAPEFPPPAFASAPPPAAPTYPAPAALSAPVAAPLSYAPPEPSHRLDVPVEPVATAVLPTAEEEDVPLLLSDRAPTTGEGQEGSDKDLVYALNQVVLLGASDLHVSVNAPPMVRVDGGLRPVEGLPVWDPEKVIAALESIMNEDQKAKFEKELELDFAYTLSETSRFRVNFYQQRNVTGAAFRLIPTQIKQLAALGVPASIGKFAQLPRGLVLVTGPTGSGKSTTLAALIDLVNSTRADHIVTVEDPIEFMHQNKKSLVNQREVGADTHSFANALKHVLRQDPDVILIGELRDLETISVALTAAETGHLVFATLHTQDAAQTIDRVIDVFPPFQQGQVRAQLAATLQGVVCQTLVKAASGKGRVVATEVMVTTPAISNLIREGKTFQIHSSLQAGRELGMFTMDQHLAELVDKGKITHAAAMDKAHDIEGLQQMIHRVDQGADATQMSSGVDFGDQFSGKVTR